MPTPSKTVMEACLRAKEDEWHKCKDKDLKKKLNMQLQGMEISYCVTTIVAKRSDIRDKMRSRTRRRTSTGEKFDDLPNQRAFANPQKRKRASQKVGKVKYDYAIGQLMNYTRFKELYLPHLTWAEMHKKWNVMLAVRAPPKARLFRGRQITLDECLQQWHTQWSRMQIEEWFRKLQRAE